MKQFFTTIAANIATLALLAVFLLLLGIGFIASLAGDVQPAIAARSLLVVDLAQPLADRSATSQPLSRFDRALDPGRAPLSLRAAVAALEQAA
jgi:hypothetical protein